MHIWFRWSPTSNQCSATKRSAEKWMAGTLFRLRIVIRIFAVQLRGAGPVGHDTENVVFAERLHGALHVVERRGPDLHHQDGPVGHSRQQVGISRKQQRWCIENGPVEDVGKLFEER